MITIQTSVVWPLSAEDSRESGEGQSASYTSSSYSFEILRVIVLYIFCFKINTLLCYTVISYRYRYWYWVLVLLEANIIGYWTLGALFGIVLTLILIYRGLVFDISAVHSKFCQYVMYFSMMSLYLPCSFRCTNTVVWVSGRVSSLQNLLLQNPLGWQLMVAFFFKSRSIQINLDLSDEIDPIR